MRIQDCGGKYGDVLVLGFQENKNITMDELCEKIHKKACYFAPKKAKSYIVEKQENTNYHGTPVKHQTGYFTIHVSYFTRSNEGWKIDKC